MPAWISSAISERRAEVRVSTQPVPIGTIKAAVFDAIRRGGQARSTVKAA
jgi:hypothetical protein